MSGHRERILDELLVLRCREGSREAFERLAVRWQVRLWRHARRLVENEHAAWDVTQEAWLVIGRDVARLRDPSRFPAWAFRIVTRAAAEWRRRRGRMEAPESELDPAAPDPPESVESVDRLRAELRRLPAPQRELLALRYAEGCELAEIAEILGIPEGTVKSRLHAAREELRQRIERKER
jgi:RNA polymerase sigma factor (sigma-70 family)